MNQTQVQAVREAVAKANATKNLVEQSMASQVMDASAYYSAWDVAKTLASLAADLESVADLLEEEFPPTLKDRCEQFISGTLDFHDFEAMLYDLCIKDGVVDKQAECLLEVIVSLWAHDCTAEAVRAVVKTITQDW